MGTYVVTGSASGIGAATAARLRGDGHEVIGIDLHDADVVADLGTIEGRRTGVEGAQDLCGGSLSGVVTAAGLGTLTGRPESSVVGVNFFGTVAVLEGMRPLLAGGGSSPAAVAISSNSATVTPYIPMQVVDACMAGDEPAARAAADEVGNSPVIYAASKIAVARWVRTHAVGADWIGAGIRLNAVAPGLTDTPMTAEMLEDPMLGPMLRGFEVPIGRSGRPEEIAGLICFLLGPESSFCCGSVLFADGGSDAALRGSDWPSGWEL